MAQVVCLSSCLSVMRSQEKENGKEKMEVKKNNSKKKKKKTFLIMVGMYSRNSPCGKQHEDIYEHHTGFVLLHRRSLFG